MSPIFEVNYIFAGISFILVLLVLGERKVRLWLRLLILFFIPVFISVIPYILFKWSAVPLTDAFVPDVDMPGLRYSSFAMALGYGVGRTLLPSMIIYISYFIIRLSKTGKSNR